MPTVNVIDASIGGNIVMELSLMKWGEWKLAGTISLGRTNGANTGNSNRSKEATYRLAQSLFRALVWFSVIPWNKRERSCMAKCCTSLLFGTGASDGTAAVSTRLLRETERRATRISVHETTANCFQMNEVQNRYIYTYSL